MLRFAYWAGLAGAICSLAMALAAWAHLSFASHATPYAVLFSSVFLTFAPAVMAHPARAGSRGSYTVDYRVLAVAEPWTIALVGLASLALIASALSFFPGGDHHMIDNASLTGRVDRQ